MSVISKLKKDLVTSKNNKRQEQKKQQVLKIMKYGMEVDK